MHRCRGHAERLHRWQPWHEGSTGNAAAPREEIGKRNRCHIGVHRVKSANTLRHYFKIVSSEFEEEADGYVENGKVVYKDPLWDVYWSNEYPVLGELKDHLTDNEFDETLWVQGFSPNEFGIYTFEKFAFLINPQGINEALLSTLIHFGDSHTDSLNRSSVQDLLDEVFSRNWIRYIKTSPIMGVFHHENGRVLRVHFGDSEIADAVESAICRMEIQFVDKNPMRED